MSFDFNPSGDDDEGVGEEEFGFAPPSEGGASSSTFFAAENLASSNSGRGVFNRRRGSGYCDDTADEEDDDNDEEDVDEFEVGGSAWLDDDDYGGDWESGGDGACRGRGSVGGEDDDGDGVDWEDADGGGDVDGGSEAQPPPLSSASHAMPTEAVTVDFSAPASASSPPNTKKKRRRRLNKISDLPPDISELVLNVRRGHMLSLTARAASSSRAASDGTVLAACHSLLCSSSPLVEEMVGPPPIDLLGLSEGDSDRGDGPVMSAAPTMDNVRRLATWFAALLNGVEERRRRAGEALNAVGAPTATARRGRRVGRRGRGALTLSSSRPFVGAAGGYRAAAPREGQGATLPCRLLEALRYISPSSDEDPEYLSCIMNEGCGGAPTAHEKAQLFVSIARSLGWRVRYAVALRPASGELTVDHPLFLTTKLGDVFHAVLGGRKTLGGVGKRKKRRKRTSSAEEIDTVDLVDGDGDDGTVGAGRSEGAVAADVGCAVGGGVGTARECDILAWAEVLCAAPVVASSPAAAVTRGRNGEGKGARLRGPSATAKPSPHQRWVHIDVERALFDEPRCVEGLLAELGRGGDDDDYSDAMFDGRKDKAGAKRKRAAAVPASAGRRRREPVSYVLAVEHAPPADGIQGELGDGDFVRFADVTPRYARAWSETLRLRGCTGKQLAKKGGRKGGGLLRCADDWWSGTLNALNRRERRRARRHLVGRRVLEKKQSVGVLWEKCFEDENSKAKDGDTNGWARNGSVDGRKSPALSLMSGSGAKDDAITLESSSEGTDSFKTDEDEEPHDNAEQAELLASAASESIPTSKAAFKNHPLYVIPSVLKSAEVLVPDAKKRICGVFKGELVYRRSDTSTALPARRWPYKGRKVRGNELKKPVKTVKARKRSGPGTFQALKTYGVGDGKEQDADAAKASAKEAKEEEEWDGKERLYGEWQTDAWAPKPVGPNDDIPTNEHKNVELRLLNPGLVHLDLRRVALVAKSLGIPYAPCLLGFEGHGGNRTPNIRGIVVHSHNADLLRSAHVEFESHSVEQQYAQRRKEIYKRWKKLILGVLTRERLEREYGDGKA